MTTYKYGMSGEGVKEVQTQLNKLGHALTVDGQFGAHTSRAVSDFQATNGLVVDGIAGEETLTTLSKKIDEKTGAALQAALYAMGKLPEISALEELL